MADIFTCPSCGAPIQYDGDGATVRCPFCSQIIIVPEALRESAPSTTVPSPLAAGQFGSLIPSQATGMVAVMQALKRGNRLEAIKHYRATFAVGLKEATDAVKAIESGQAVILSQQGVTTTVTSASYPAPTLRAGGGRCALTMLFLIVVMVSLFAVLGSTLFQVGVRSIPYEVATFIPEQKGEVESGPLRIEQSLGNEGIGAGNFSDARSVAVDREGRLYTVEYLGGRVQRFRPDGTFDGQWMVDAAMPVRDMSANRAGELLIVQQGRITRYNGATGEVLGTIGDPEQRYDAIAPTLDGGLVALGASVRDETLERFDAGGQRLFTLRAPISSQTGQSLTSIALAVDGENHIYVASGRDEAILHFDAEGRFVNRFGSRGMEPGQFTALSGVAVDGQGRLYTSDFQGIQQFTRDGRYLGVVDPDTPVNGFFMLDDNSFWVAGRSRLYHIVPVD